MFFLPLFTSRLTSEKEVALTGGSSCPGTASSMAPFSPHRAATRGWEATLPPSGELPEMSSSHCSHPLSSGRVLCVPPYFSGHCENIFILGFSFPIRKETGKGMSFSWSVYSSLRVLPTRSHVIHSKAPSEWYRFLYPTNKRGWSQPSKKTKPAELGRGRNRTQVSPTPEHITTALFETLSPAERSVQHRCFLSYTGAHMHELPQKNQ